jgi:DNA-3-methyladenine glycosylase II
LASGALDLAGLAKMDDKAAQAELVKVRGIGRWTAEIYLLFALGRADIWPAGDGALMIAIQHLKRLRRRPTMAQMDRMAEPWRPYRGTAARLLWSYRRVMRQNSRL